jgi:hypothetical protein
MRSQSRTPRDELLAGLAGRQWGVRGEASGARRAAASALSRGLCGGSWCAARRGAAVGGGAGVRAGRGAQPSQRGGALGAAGVGRRARGGHRAPDTSRPPRDPPAPDPLPRCPRHHQPRGHPGHHGRADAAGPRGDRQRGSPGAGVRAGVVPAALRPHSDHRRHRPRQRAPRNAGPGRSDRPRTAVHQERLGDPHAQAHPHHGPARAARQPPPHCPGPRPLPGRLLLAPTPPDRRDRQLARHRAAYEQDRAKDAALQAAGYRVVRFTWHTNDTTILRRLHALLG